MIEVLRRISINSKLKLLSFFPMTIFVVTSVYLVYAMYTSAVDTKKAATKQVVEAAMSAVNWAYSKQKAGEWTEAQAQAEAKNQIRSLRYGGGDYFWINGMDHKMIMHPEKPDLEGKDMSETKDPDGVALFVKFVDTVKASKAGFVEYRWPRPGENEPIDKISYVAGFEPWGWVLGSGVYVDDLKKELLSRLGELGLILVMAALACMYIGSLISRIITRGVDKAVRVANDISRGRIDSRIEVKGSDEIAQLLRAMSSMSGELGHLIKEVRSAAESLSTASQEIASGNMDLSARTEQTAANLQQTAASMMQLTNEVASSAQAAQDANGHVAQASDVATRGGTVVSEVVTTMDGIHTAASKINDIIGVIDTIAFQTNILALNAAVEAARAGEQGRGFAVVASEVRSLAQRSASAAKEIKTLITTSVETVDQGTQLVSKAGETMREIVESVYSVNKIMSTITDGTLRQRDGIAHVNSAVTNLDQMTQQNAALVEQSAAAAASLRDQAIALTQAVGRFELADGA